MEAAIAADGQPSDCRPFLTHTEMCLRLPPPPPVLPWLRDKPIMLRHLLTNCSSWKTYTDVCLLQVQSEYQQPLPDLPSGTTLSQWIPLITALLISALIVTSAGFAYFLYQSDRMTFLDKYLTHGHKWQICKERHKRPSIPKVAQLSVCMLKDDYFRNRTPPQVIADQLAHRRSNNDVSRLGYPTPWHKAEEIILLPEDLQENDLQSPFYVANLPGSDYYSSHSLPVDADWEKLTTSTQQQHSEMVSSYFDSDDDIHMSSFVELQMKKPDRGYKRGCERQLKKYCQLGNHNYRIMSMRGVVQRCRQSLIHRVAFLNRGSGHALSQQQKSIPTFVKLRRSVYKMCTSRSNFQTSKTVQTFKSSNDSSSIVNLESQSYACPSVCMESSVPDRGQDIDNSKFHRAENRLRQVGQLLRHGKTAQKQGKTHKQLEHREVPTFTYVNEAFENAHASGVKCKNPFRKMTMPNVLRKINKSKLVS